LLEKKWEEMSHATVNQGKNISTVVELYKKETINTVINKADPTK
jgi:hypothetical protein